MRSGLLKIFFFFLLIPAGLIGNGLPVEPMRSFPNMAPTITGPNTVCANGSSYIYITESGKSNYVWNVSSGGTITSPVLDNDSITVTWITAGPQTVSVIYDPETTPGVMNVTVFSPVVVGITISASANPVCAGTLVTYTATATNGGSAPEYKWIVNGVEAATNSVFSYYPNNGDIITCELTSNLFCTTVNPVTSDSIIMIVNQNLPVTISIAASSNPSCEGNLVTFTATVENGGPGPVYQWKVNGLNVGTSIPTHSYIPVNGDIVTCVLTSNVTCASGNPAISNPVTMTVSPALPVTVTITASANPACLGNLVTFTAIPVNGGSVPVYHWKKNGEDVGINSSSYTYPPINGDVVFCVLTSNAGCTTGNPANSNEIIMTVIPFAPVSISITASANPVCSGISVTFNATVINGGFDPLYQWTVNTFLVSTDPTYSYFPANGDVVICTVTSDMSCATGNPAISNPITMTVIPNLPASVSIIASANPACQGTVVQFTATAINGGSTPEYQWKVNGVNVGINSQTYTYTPVNGEIVTCEMTSSDFCSLGDIVTSNAITMMVSPGLAVGVTISASANPVCQGGTVLFVATPVNGGSAPFYDWMDNGVSVDVHTASYSCTPSDGHVFTCKLTSSLGCATGNPAISNAITMVVSSSLPVSINISVSSNPSCQGQAVTYTATTVNGGTSPTFQWMVNNVNMGFNLPEFSYIPNNQDSVVCYFTSSHPCSTGNPATTNKVYMTVNPNLAVSVTITSSVNPSCQGSQVTYTATASNGGSNPAYQWKVNGLDVGLNQSTYTYVPSNGNVVTCQLTSSVPCPLNNPVTSNVITQTVYPIVPAGITISASANPICTGTQVTFTATATNGGSPPAFQWKLNGWPVGSNSTLLIFIPANGDVITCQLTSSLMCVSGNPVTSSPITMVVSSSLTTSAVISASSNPFCQGATVNYSVTTINGGSTPTYQWQVNGLNTGSNSPIYSYQPLNGDYVTCSVTSSLACASPNPVTSNPIYMQLNTNTPAGISITASANPVCQGSPVTFAATAINGGSAPAYQWQVNGINQGMGLTYTYTPENGDMITCKLTSNASCVSGSPATSDTIVMAVNTAFPASVFISTSTNPFCENDAVTFTAASINGGSAPGYQWKVDGVDAGTGSPSYTYFPVNGDLVTCWLTSNSSCISGPNPVQSNTITMTATTALPVGVSIAASANPVCQGTAVTYTATPINGGSTPVYQWKVDGENKGTNNPYFTCIPLNGNIITCFLTSSLNCATGNPAPSNAITMIVNPPQPVIITIAASSNPVCVGIMETFTAATINGGSNPVYQWRVNGLFVGTNSPTFSYTPLNGDVVTCQVTSNATCISGNPAISNPIAIVVRPEQPVSVTITASANPFCIGEQVTYTALPVNGGTVPIYQWKVNGVITGGNNPFYIYTPNAGDSITCQLTSNQACICNNPAISNKIIMVASSNLPVSITITTSANPICAGTNVSFTATSVNGGNNPIYQWKVNGINGGTNLPVYYFPPANGDTITCQLTSNLTCATGNPATSNPITMTVHPLLPVSVNITATANPTCVGSTVCYAATVTNGGTAPFYRWRVNGANIGTNSPAFCYVPLNGDVIYCRVTSNATCASGNPANSNSISMNVIPYGNVSVSISSSANPVCQGTSVTFTAIPVNGGTSPVYHWKVNGTDAGTNSPTYSYIPGNGDVVYCEILSNAYCLLSNTATSNSITITVSPSLPVSVLIAASANPVCQGASVTFTATPANGGTLPSYQWKVNGANAGTNSSSFTYTPSDLDIVTCILTSNAACTQGSPATSNSITLNVSVSIPVSVGITASSYPICAGQTICYTAIPVNEGPTPVYQWMINGMGVGFNTPTYCYTPTSGDIVSCQLTSSYACASGNPAVSNQIALTFFPNLPVSISISCSANPSCQGTIVTYTATGVNGGSAPVYQWKVNGIIAGGNITTYSYTPLNGDVITCRLTSNIPCPINNPATSNPLTMAVLVPVSATVSISASANPVCLGTPVTYTASAVNGGSAPVYHWHKNGLDAGGNFPTFTDIPADGDIVTCQLTSSITCAITNPVLSNMITMAVSSDFPVSVAISASSNPACQGQSITYTAIAVNGGSALIYQWYVNGINVGTDSSTYIYFPTNSDIVTCTVTSSYSCASNNPAASNQVIMTVNPILPVSISISSSFNPACLGTVVTYTATAINGGPSPAYQWKVNGVNSGINSPSFPYIPANGDIITCQVTSSLTCVSGNPAISNQIIMITGTGFPVSVLIAASANPICVETQVTYTATPTYGGSIPTYQWKVNGIDKGSDSTKYTCYPAQGDQTTCTLTSNLTCGTGNPATSNVITMTVLPVPVGIAIEASPTGEVCAGDYVTFTATPQNGGANPTYKWKVNGFDAGTNNPVFCYQPANGEIVTCLVTSNATCASGNTAISNPITMTVNPHMPVGINITADPSGFICTGTQVTYTAIALNGGSAPFYQWKVNGDAVGSNSSIYSCFPSDGDIITCTMTSNLDCTTGNPATSNAITMTVLFVPISISITASTTDAVCAGTYVTFTAIPLNGGTNPTFFWKVNDIDTGTNNPVFSYPPADGDIVTCVLASNATCAAGNTATSNPITMAVNPILPVSINITASANPVCVGVPVTFTGVSLNGGTTPVYQWKVNSIDVGINSPAYSYTPLNGDVITCIVTSNATCASGSPATSNTITITINPNLPVSISIGATPSGANCDGTSVSFTGAVINGGPMPVYQWKVNGVDAGTNNSAYSYVPSNGDIVSCVLTSNAICATGNPATSNTIVMIVNQTLPVSIGITASPSGAVCVGAPVTYTGTALNGGAAPAYQWKVNGVDEGTNNSTYNYIPSNGDIVSCVLTSDAICSTGNPATSNPIGMIVNPLMPVSAIISADPPGVHCAGTQVTYTAVTFNGGSSPSYQWKVNGLNAGGSAITFNYTPMDGDVITCILTSNLTCATGNPAISNELTMTVNSILPVSIGITSNSSGTVCEGTMVTFTGAAMNGGSTPVYQWKVNGTDVGTDNSTYSYIPLNGDIITCILTSNAICANGNPAVSNAIVMTVNPNLPVSIGITASVNPVCEGIPVTFTGAAINCGSTPVYQWNVNGDDVGTNSDSYSYTPSNGDLVTCDLISNATCATGSPAISNTIVMTVSPNLPVSITISASVNPVCEGIPVMFTGAAINCGSTPVYQWNVNGVDVGTNSNFYSYSPSNGDLVICKLTSNATCATGNPSTSNAIIMEVNPLAPVTVTITAPFNPTCEGTSLCYVATIINGGSSPVFQWQINGITAGSNASTFCYIPLNGDVISCRVTSNFACASPNPAYSNDITMTVNPLMPVSISIIASENPVCDGVPVTFTGSAMNGGSSPIYQWKVNGIDCGTNNSVYSYTPLNGDVITCILTSNEICPAGSPATSNAITISTNPNLPVSIGITANPSGPICQGSLITFTGAAINCGPAPVYQWNVNGVDAGTNNSSYSYTPSNGDLVTCTLTSNATCATGNPATSNTITMTVNPNLPVSIDISADPSENICEGTPVTFTGAAINYGSTPVYQWQVNTINVGSNLANYFYNPVNGDEVTCILTSDEICTSGNPATSNPITMTVAAMPVVTFIQCIDPITTTNAKPFKLKGGIPLGGIYSGPGVNSSTGMFDPYVAGAGIQQLTYTYDNASSCSASATLAITTLTPDPVICGTDITDPRDGQHYATVPAGSQCWFARNLNYGEQIYSSATQRDNCQVEKYCSYDDPLLCQSVGGFYHWDEIMQYEDQEAAQGFCPPGWHVPNEVEWNYLFNLFSGGAYAGDALKSGGPSGFDAILAGGFFKNRSWAFKDLGGFFWSSTTQGTMKAWAHGLNENNHGVSFYPSSRSNAYSVRCLKD